MTQKYAIDFRVPPIRWSPPFEGIVRSSLERVSDRASSSAMPPRIFRGFAWRRGRSRVWFAGLEPREDGVGDIHAGDGAQARQASGVDRAADEVADDRRQGKEEADRDPGEAGQDEQDCLRGNIGDAAGYLGGPQASIPKQGEDDDCGGDPNGEAPLPLKLSTPFRTNAWRRRSKRRFAPHSVGGREESPSHGSETSVGRGRSPRLPAARRLLTRDRELVLRLRFKVTGVMALV